MAASERLPGSCGWERRVGASRYVGDPVDIVTGAVVDEETDFRLVEAAVAFSWVRYYDSRRSAEDRGLGFGFRHALDCELRFDLDGLTYVDGQWHVTRFPFLTRDGERVLEQSLRLERVSPRHYRVHEPSGRRLEFSFAETSAAGRLMRVHDVELTLELEYAVDPARPTALRLASLGRLRLVWADSRLARAVFVPREPERESDMVRYRYDETGRLVETQNAYQHSLRYEFDAAGRLVRKTDRRGYHFLFQYDAAGRCVESHGEDGADAVALAYKPLERTTLVTRHDGGRWQYQYDANGTITHVLDPYGGMHAFVVDASGRVTHELDPHGNETRILHDSRGVAVAKNDAFGHEVALAEGVGLTQHPLEHRTPATPLECELGSSFAAPSRLPSSDAPVWEAPVDVRAWLHTADPLWIADPGADTRMERTLQGLPLREQRADGKVRRWAFDENANVRWQIDFDGAKHEFDYCSDNHLAAVIDPLGGVTRYEYSPSEQLTAITDPGGTRSVYVRDQKDRVVEVHRDGRLRERYSYDLADNLVEKRDGDGELLLEQTIGRGSQVLSRRLGSGESQSFVYDERGRLIEAHGQAGRCSFTYDPLGPRLSDLRAGRGVEHSSGETYERTTTVLGRFVTRYRRETVSDLTVTDPTGHCHRLRELVCGIHLRSFACGIRELSQFDTRGRCVLKGLYRQPGDERPWLRSFHFSGEGDLLERRDSELGMTRYAYDRAHRLQRVMHAGRPTEGYAYDAAGNLTHMPSVLLEARALELSDRFELHASNQLRSAHGQRFHYDARGHVSRRDTLFGSVYYQRNSLEQLIKLSAPRLEFDAVYDPLGRRTQKTVNGQTTQYYWDSDRLAAEVYPDGRLRVYVYAAPALSLVPMMFIDYAGAEADPDSGQRYYVVSDHRGAVELILDDAGQPVWRARLDPYGLAHVEVGQHVHQPLRFPGHFFDAETGLHYNRFRYYDPAIGRYLESDPIGIDGGLNLYAYTDNPLSEVDLRGLAKKCPNGKDCPQRKRAESEGHDGKEGTDPPSKLKGNDAPASKGVEVTEDHHAKLKHLAPGVTAHDVALAEHRNVEAHGPSTDQRAARKKVADAFYKKNGQEFSFKDENKTPYGADASGKPIKKVRPQTDSERADQLAAIDYNDPVVVGPPPPCQRDMKQWQAAGNDRGSYYADERTTPSQLGIGDEGKAWNHPGQPVVRKTASPCTIDPSTPYMESTAGPADDTWSVPGRSQPAPGGGRQTYIPDGCNPNSTLVSS